MLKSQINRDYSLKSCVIRLHIFRSEFNFNASYNFLLNKLFIIRKPSSRLTHKHFEKLRKTL